MKGRPKKRRPKKRRTEKRRTEINKKAQSGDVDADLFDGAFNDLLGMLNDEQTGAQRGRRGRTHQDIEKFLKDKNEALKSKQCDDELRRLL